MTRTRIRKPRSKIWLRSGGTNEAIPGCEARSRLSDRAHGRTKLGRERLAHDLDVHQ